MAFTDNYDFSVLENESEKLITEELGRQLALSAENVCRCNTCVVDMAAMALNAVKPLYRVSLLGTQYASQAMSDPAYADSVKNAVARAIKKVTENPGHD